ncbi:MAG: hypothetical protein LUD72_10020 [Bacteroidales bacterium]|nr:hypothetical protein [Bacteroidales bacterium]
MKRFVLTFVALCFAVVSVSAAQLTPEQRRVKVEILSYLTKISDNVYGDSEETLSFETMNTKFSVRIVSEEVAPLLITLGLKLTLPDEFDSDLVGIAAIKATAGMPVSIVSENGYLVFNCGMYVNDASPFLAGFRRMMKALMSSCNNFNDAYQETLNSHAPKSEEQPSILRHPDNVFIFPKINDAGDSRLCITKVTFDSQYTVLDMVSYNGGAYQYCSISKDSYILTNKGRRYTLEKAEGIAYSPGHTDYPNWESENDVSLSFRLYFPPLSEGITSFSFSEGDEGWQLGDVELEHGNLFEVGGTEIETSTHIWNCTSIEIREGQTIVSKVVTPKVYDTYVYSSQEECIEDAETGRRFYLQESSIGFEGSPTILQSTYPITFYEVYPVLPANVERINIRFGDSYYVKDLKIR